MLRVQWSRDLMVTFTFYVVEVSMEKHWESVRKATVCANFGATATSYSTLLEYSM